MNGEEPEQKMCSSQGGNFPSALVGGLTGQSSRSLSHYIGHARLDCFKLKLLIKKKKKSFSHVTRLSVAYYIAFEKLNALSASVEPTLKQGNFRTNNIF